VKRAFTYRFYPTDAQAAELSRTFGCVRKVSNMALQARTEAWARQERVNYNATSAMLTAWKKTGELAYLCEVSSVPLQQCLRHLQGAFVNFWEKRGKYPRFKSKKKSRHSAEYTSSAFRYRDGQLMLAKMKDPLDIVWSRSLPKGAVPTAVTVSQDAARHWFVFILCEDAGVRPLPPGWRFQSVKPVQYLNGVLRAGSRRRNRKLHGASRENPLPFREGRSQRGWRPISL
jgi:putative transposase